MYYVKHHGDANNTQEGYMYMSVMDVCERL